MACKWRPEEAFQSQFWPFTMWSPGIKLRSSDLTEDTFTYLTMSLACGNHLEQTFLDQTPEGLGARMLCTQFQGSWKQHYISSGLLAPGLACNMTGHLLLSLFLLGLRLLCCPPYWSLFLWELELVQDIPHIIWNFCVPCLGQRLMSGVSTLSSVCLITSDAPTVKPWSTYQWLLFLEAEGVPQWSPLRGCIVG